MMLNISLLCKIKGTNSEPLKKSISTTVRNHPERFLLKSSQNRAKFELMLKTLMPAIE